MKLKIKICYPLKWTVIRARLSKQNQIFIWKLDKDSQLLGSSAILLPKRSKFDSRLCHVLFCIVENYSVGYTDLMSAFLAQRLRIELGTAANPAS